MRIVSVILGALMVVGGVYCLMSPLVTFSTLGWIVGVAMMAEGAGSIMSWNERRLMGFADGWTLAGAILSLVMGVVVVGSTVAQFSIDSLITYLAAFWLILRGIASVFAAFALRGVNEKGRNLGSNWWLVLIVGILITIMGVICLTHPLLTMLSIGTLMGMGIISTGCGLMAAGFSR